MMTNQLQIPFLSLWEILLWLGIFAAIFYCGSCIFLFVMQTRLIFFPAAVLEKTPEFFNLDYQEVWLSVAAKSNKLEPIHGWWIKANQSNGKVLLYLHGNGINIGANIGHAKRFYQLGFSVLLIDYRGYGRSQGSFPNEKRVYEDATAAWNYLVQQQKIPPQQIVIYGHSLGGAIAIDLAIKHPDAAGLIVESSFTSIQEIIAHRQMLRLFPVSFLLTQRFTSIKKLSQLHIPVLFIHGTVDLTVPAFMSQKLYNAASEPKKLILVPGAGHNNVAELAGEQYLQWVKSFIAEIYLQKLEK
jgi:fermentation-respiration switch protein FrsA (DUF1100 family)